MFFSNLKKSHEVQTHSLRIAAAVLWVLVSACAPTNDENFAKTPLTTGQTPPVLPDFMDDPFEPVNRGVWAVNEGVLLGVMQPTSKFYRAVVPPPARRSIRHFARNATYPGRLINHALQGCWQSAGDESLRFLCNTTAGVAGFFDVASRWNIPKSDADFAETFTRWGWKPSLFIMLPFLGPSDETHALGLAADRFAEPWSYGDPYRYVSYGTTYNRISETTESAAQIIHSEADPYALVKYAWGYASKDEKPDWTLRGAADAPTLQTLNVARITTQNPDFTSSGRQRRVRIASTGKNFQFNYWLQNHPAPLVYISPGLGSHRLSLSPVSVAEHLYLNGFSVVTTSSVFHPEFMEAASTADLPAYPPIDSHDLHVALTEIDRLLSRKHPGKFTQRALLGCSMGAFQALYLASHEGQQDSSLVHFSRYVAINTPVNLHQGIANIDAYHNAPQAWPADQRQELVNQSVHKATMMGFMPPAFTPSFSGIESKYLIGLTFRLILRDAIFSSQSRHNMGVVQSPLSQWRRESCYQEILGFSYMDYFTRFVLPYYQSRGISKSDFAREANLMTYSKPLHNNRNIRLLTNRNDFLLTPQNFSWLKSTFGNDRLKIFPDGGHLGNLATPPVQKAILDALDGLK